MSEWGLDKYTDGYWKDTKWYSRECLLEYVIQLEARIKALEANTSKSVLRRIDAQLGVDDETD